MPLVKIIARRGSIDAATSRSTSGTRSVRARRVAVCARSNRSDGHAPPGAKTADRLTTLHLDHPMGPVTVIKSAESEGSHVGTGDPAFDCYELTDAWWSIAKTRLGRQLLLNQLLRCPDLLRGHVRGDALLVGNSSIPVCFLCL